MKIFFFYLILCSPALAMQNSYFFMHDHCYFGRLDAVQSSIDRGCDVNQKNNYGLTPLMMAVQMYNQAVPAKDYYEIATLLFSRGADATIQTEDGRTALDLCTQNTGGSAEKIKIRDDIKKLLRQYMSMPS